MRGTIIEHQPKKGKKTFGYSLFVGRDDSGKQLRQVKRGFIKKSEAEDALRKAIEEHQQTPAPERTMPTFAEFFERWYATAKRDWENKTSERTYELGQYAVRLFGDVPLDRLDTMRLTEEVAKLSDHGGRVTKNHPQGKPLSPKTVRHIAFTVQACFEKAVDWEILQKNAMKKVKKPKVPRRRPKVVDNAGFDLLLKRLSSSHYYPFIILASATGMRRGELCALQWSDIDFEAATLEVSKSLEETKASGIRVKSTKSGEARRFSIPSDVLEVLRDYKHDQDHQRELYGNTYAKLDLIFCRPDGAYLSPKSLGSRVNKLIKSAGLPGISLHSLRHSHASQLLSQGAPITSVSERLGHASPNITLSIYSHALPADNAATAKLWNDAMSSVIQESRKEAAKNRRLSQVITEEGGNKIIAFKSAV